MFYILNKETREEIRRSESPVNIDENVQPEDATLIQLKEVRDLSEPAFNPATEKIVWDFTDDDGAFTRTWSWSVVSLANGELATVQRNSQDETARLSIKGKLTALKAGTGTQGERIARLEEFVAYLSRFDVRK